MWKYLNKGISTPIAITIILLLAILVGGFTWWKYSEIEKSKEGFEIELPEKVTEDKCKNIQDLIEQGNCYAGLAKETKDENYCGKIEIPGMPEIRAGCYSTLAFLKNDSSICEKVETASLRSSCIKHFGEFIQTGSIKLLDSQTLQGIQEEVDKGHQPWRLDSLLAAKSDSLQYGFKETDEFTLISEELGEYAGTYIAYVEARHDNKVYNIQLIQPVKIGSGGIWTINSITAKGVEDETADWKTYINEEYGFEMKYPEDWNLWVTQPDEFSPQGDWREQISELAVFQSRVKSIPYCEFHLAVCSNPKDFSIEDFWRTRFPEVYKLKSSSSIIFGKNQVSGEKFFMERTDQPLPNESMVIITRKGSDIIKLLWWGQNPSVLNPDCLKVKQMLSTFKFLD